MTAVLVPGEPRVTLSRSGGLTIASGGTVAYTVNIGGRWVGWVYDERPWLGSRFGARSWSWAWRETDDWHARVTSTGHRTRQTALDGLITAVRTGRDTP